MDSFSTDYRLIASVGLPEMDRIIDQIYFNGEYCTQVLVKIPGTRNEYKVDASMSGHVSFDEVIKTLETKLATSKNDKG